jgi:hypothetical protein
LFNSLRPVSDGFISVMRPAPNNDRQLTASGGFISVPRRASKRSTSVLPRYQEELMEQPEAAFGRKIGEACRKKKKISKTV